MSTENEGAAVPPGVEPPSAPETPVAGPASASGAPTADSARRAEPARPPAPPAQGHARVEADTDYALPAPEERTAQLPTVGAGGGRSDSRSDGGSDGGFDGGSAARTAEFAEYPAYGARSAHGTPPGQEPQQPSGPHSEHPGQPGAAGQPGAHGQPGAPGQPGQAYGSPGAASPAGGAGWPPPPPPGSGWGSGPAPDPVPPPPGGSPRKRTGMVVAAVLTAALVAGGVGGGIGYLAADRGDSTGSTTVSASGDPEVLNRSPKSVSGIAQRALPSVVTLDAQGSQGEGGTGTGFVYDKQGHILTNNHVVASAADGGKLTATFSNGKKYDAEVVGRAQGYDVAVLRLKNASDAKLNPLPLGDSEKKVAVGDATIAIGAPFGLAGTVTTGIISAKNRPVASSDGGSSNASYMSALQTDASINPGNSGGPLLNAQGAVIGINSAIQSAGNGLGGEAQQSGSIGLGFAIPINQAKRVAETLIRTSEPVYPVIGVQVDMREQGEGARISQTGNGGSEAVTPGGPADKAGLKPGDVITKLDDTVIDSGPTLISTIWTHQPGDQVKLTYERDGKTSTVDVTLGSRKGDS
ncbi:trypsin-like peptidase domain-containing protein [Streptomyces sp. 7N604]|uniref:trypsin-like peptidase domain-containing protein n=1 Tax=Streptomyces sp. 7N604 TaxID=3457415 RepID=UPI003FD6ADD0